VIERSVRGAPRRRRRLAASLAFALAAAPLARTASAETLCPRASLPAYAHNDYQNARPLADALRLGFRGVEADVFLIGDTLRVGHDARRAARAAAFESLYLAPLDSLVARCGTLTADGAPLFLALELKERSPAAYAELLRVLEKHSALFAPASVTARAPVEVVLVGWRPAFADSTRDVERRLGHQYRLTRPESARAVPADTRLVSLDYGKTMGRPWVRVSGRRRWLAALRDARRAAPLSLVRVHNVPADADVYAALLEAGVDLIGTSDLAATRRLLTTTPTK
jgi:hypothetical protein